VDEDEFCGELFIIESGIILIPAISSGFLVEVDCDKILQRFKSGVMIEDVE
jgi:hypothetical protein